MSLRQILRVRLGALPAGLFLTLTLSSCQTCNQCHNLRGGCLERNCFDKCATIIPGSLPEPNGSYASRIQDIQVIKAEADDFVFYLHEWRGADLGPYGQYHLTQIINRVPGMPFPVIIEPSADAELDGERLTKIIAALEAAGVTDAISRVRVGYPEAEGLDANEAERIYVQSLQNFGQYGNGGYGFGGIGRFGRSGWFGGFGRGLGFGEMGF